ncbi:hypothetical protein [Nitrosopumilus sp. S6]
MIFLFVLIFPNYIISYNLEIIPEGFDRSKSSVWLLPVIISNGVFFALLILYKSNLLPKKIINLKDRFLEKDISKSISFLVILGILVIYIAFSIDEFYTEELVFGDYTLALEGAENWYRMLETPQVEPVLRYFFLFLSLEYLGNIRFLPFVASIGVLLLTYFISKEISGKRISGLIAFCTVLQSNLFLMYDTTATYENFWTFFYFLSLYLIIKNSITSTFSFLITLFLKPITILFIPLNVLWVGLDQQVKNRKKLFLGFSSIIVLVLVAFFTQSLVHTQDTSFNIENMFGSFNEIANSLRFDSLLIIILIPVIVLLYLQSKNLHSRKMFILFGIFIMMASQVFLFGVIDMSIQPYRFVPLVVMISIGFGIIFSKERRCK